MNLMDQYSQQSGKCVRSQALVGLTVGVLEPYVSFDERFRRISLSRNFRIDPFLDRLSRRYQGVADPPAAKP